MDRVPNVRVIVRVNELDLVLPAMGVLNCDLVGLCSVLGVNFKDLNLLVSMVVAGCVSHLVLHRHSEVITACILKVIALNCIES